MRVSLHVGLTFQVGPMSSNQYGRVDLNLDDIDPEQPVEAQIEGGVAAAQLAFRAALTELDQQTEALYSTKT